MNTRLLLLLLIFACTNCPGQTDSTLDAYLASHRYTIHQEKDSSTSFGDARIPAMLDHVMQNKQMFVWGDGYNHELELNTDLPFMFARHFADRGLKYYFREAPRSWLVDIDVHIADDIKLDSFYKRYSHYRPRYYREEKRLRAASSNFQVIPTDFERRTSFQYIINLVRNTIPKANLPRLIELAPYVQDTSYLEVNNFVAFYTAQRDRFLADSNNFKEVLGNLYPHFRYLMTDPLPASYNGNRNGNMAKHILMQIGDAPAGEIYMLNIGNGHVMYRDGVRKTTVGVLRDSRQLHDKILVASLYCEDCVVNGLPNNGHNGGLKYINGPVLESFQKAANNDIILFDLTELPPQFQYLTAKSDLLVFAKRGR